LGLTPLEVKSSKPGKYDMFLKVG